MLTVTEGHSLAHDVSNALRDGDPLVADVLVHVEPFEDGRERDVES
jgi:divalent metal cation (Fe/Co/Zn/Cd) transporter